MKCPSVERALRGTQALIFLLPGFVENYTLEMWRHHCRRLSILVESLHPHAGLPLLILFSVLNVSLLQVCVNISLTCFAASNAAIGALWDYAANERQAHAGMFIHHCRWSLAHPSAECTATFGPCSLDAIFSQVTGSTCLQLGGWVYAKRTPNRLDSSGSPGTLRLFLALAASKSRT